MALFPWIFKAVWNIFLGRPSSLVPRSIGFLAAVLTSASGPCLLGKMSRVESKWVTPRPGRRREPSGIKQERLPFKRETKAVGCKPDRNGCCTACPAGKFLKNCTCETCGDETYLEHWNSEEKCHGCKQCDAPQVEVRECAPEHKRICGCPSGYYRENDHDAYPEDFFCHRCDNCTGQNKQTKKNCSEMSNTMCGDCLPNFHPQGDKCQKITSGEQPHNVQRAKDEKPGDRKNTEDGQPGDLRNTAYFLLCLPCLLLLGATITYFKRRRISGKSSPVDPSHQRSLLQGRKLYAVIDVVPARRWKEFMRGLGLRDGEIEAVEVEHTQLREQQYEMLKRWRQQQGATADAIFAVLEAMQLGGCAQELREQMQPSPLLSNL